LHLFCRNGDRGADRVTVVGDSYAFCVVCGAPRDEITDGFAWGCPVGGPDDEPLNRWEASNCLFDRLCGTCGLPPDRIGDCPARPGDADPGPYHLAYCLALEEAERLSWLEQRAVSEHEECERW
jgi:hypothetical protein